MQPNPKRIIVIAVLWLMIILSILAQLGTISKILNLMLTSGEELPLQQFLNRFYATWDLVDTILSTLLTGRLYNFLYFRYSWGGFTYTLILKNIINYLKNPDKVSLSKEQAIGRGLSLIFAAVMLISIIYGLNREKWVPYVQQPTWLINMVHKQQISAGTYLIIFLFIYFHGVLPGNRGHTGSMRFYSNQKLMIFVFAAFMLDNLGSFDWFFEGLGYEEIFLYGQTAYSFDKVYHFSASAALTVILLMYITQTRFVVVLAILSVIFWELFEITLNPLEASDSMLDMLFNSSAILLTAFLYNRFENKSLGERNHSFS